MKNIYILFAALSFLACNDGNIDVPEFVFEGDPSKCGSLVLFKVNGAETLSLELNQNNDFLTVERTEFEIQLTEDGSNTIVYRTFDATVSGSNYFCQDIPPTEPNLLNEWKGNGTLVITTVLTFDDNDGVAEEEDDSLDTDKDGTPNYLDRDDDGDGILTINEDLDGDGDPTNDNTDGDALPNYLDDDDDDDGTKTIDEDVDENGNIENDDTDGDDIPNYLDADDSEKSNTPLNVITILFEEVYTSQLTISPLQLTNANDASIRLETFGFGSVTEKVTQPEENN